MSVQDQLQELGQANFQILCEALDKINTKYDKKEEDLYLHFAVGEGKEAIHIIAAADARLSKIVIMGALVKKISGGGREVNDYMIDLAIAASAVNGVLNIGSFVLDFESGSFDFKISYHYFDKVLDQGVISQLYSMATQIVAQYRPLFINLLKDEIDIEDFLDDLYDE